MSRLYLRSGKLLHLAQSNTLAHANNSSKLSPAQISAPFSPRTILGLTSPTPVSPLGTATSINARLSSAPISPLTASASVSNARIVSTASSVYSLFPPPSQLPNTPIRSSTASSVYSVPSIYVPTLHTPILSTIHDVAPTPEMVRAKARAAPPPPLNLEPPTPPPKSPLYPSYTVETPGSALETGTGSMFRFERPGGVPPPAPSPPMTPFSACLTPGSGLRSAFGGLKFPHRREKEVAVEEKERELVISSPIIGLSMVQKKEYEVPGVKVHETVYPDEKIWPRTPLKVNMF